MPSPDLTTLRPNRSRTQLSSDVLGLTHAHRFACLDLQFSERSAVRAGLNHDDGGATPTPESAVAQVHVDLAGVRSQGS